MHTLLAAASVAQSLSVSAHAAAHVATQSSVASGIASFIETTVPSVVASVLPSGATSTSAAALRAPLSLVPPPFEVAATFVGAVSGALVAVRKRFDMVGVVTLAFVAGLGGGIIRDVLLQKYGIAAFQHDYLLLTALVAAFVGFFFASAIRQGRFFFVLVDAVALGLFAVVGADKAVVAMLGIIPAILLGAITSTGGGVLRDVLTGEVPNVLQPGSLYAAAAVAGATTYILLLEWLDLVKPVAAVAAVTVVLLLRFAAIWLGWQTPSPVDLTPHVARLVPERVKGVARRIGHRLPEVPVPPGAGYSGEARAERPPPAEPPPDDSTAREDAHPPDEGKT